MRYCHWAHYQLGVTFQERIKINSLVGQKVGYYHHIISDYHEITFATCVGYFKLIYRFTLFCFMDSMGKISILLITLVLQHFIKFQHNTSLDNNRNEYILYHPTGCKVIFLNLFLSLSLVHSARQV